MIPGCRAIRGTMGLLKSPPKNKAENTHPTKTNQSHLKSSWTRGGLVQNPGPLSFREKGLSTTLSQTTPPSCFTHVSCACAAEEVCPASLSVRPPARPARSGQSPAMAFQCQRDSYAREVCLAGSRAGAGPGARVEWANARSAPRRPLLIGASSLPSSPPPWSRVGLRSCRPRATRARRRR